jgi:hypothetical protein
LDRRWPELDRLGADRMTCPALLRDFAFGSRAEGIYDCAVSAAGKLIAGRVTDADSGWFSAGWWAVCRATTQR